jgi:hypothetical protein
MTCCGIAVRSRPLEFAPHLRQQRTQLEFLSLKLAFGAQLAGFSFQPFELPDGDCFL